MAEDERVDWLPPLAEGARPAPQFDPEAKPPPPPAPPAPQHGHQPWPQPHARPPGNTAALVSLISGIAGLVVFVFPAGFGLIFVFNLPCSIMAWAFGVRGRRAVDRGYTHERRGMAQAGLVLGIVGTALGVLAIVGWALAFALSEELRREFQRQIEESSNPSAIVGRPL